MLRGKVVRSISFLISHPFFLSPLFFFFSFSPLSLSLLCLLSSLPNKSHNTNNKHTQQQLTKMSASSPAHLHKCTDATIVPGKTTIHFTITDKVGALDECLAAIKAMNISLTRIES